MLAGVGMISLGIFMARTTGYNYTLQKSSMTIYPGKELQVNYSHGISKQTNKRLQAVRNAFIHGIKCLIFIA